jgi:site-specific DNA-cytosine methylase
MKTALDLCCGKGGWARGLMATGWRVIGVDFADFSAVYPGEFIRADLITWDGWRDMSIQLVVASPPCDEYSRWSMPWTRAKNPPPPSHHLWWRCVTIAKTLRVPFVLENVRGAQHFHGRSKMNCGPFHLWYDVPAILPTFGGKKKESYGSKQKADRAVIPFELAAHIGRCFA